MRDTATHWLLFVLAVVSGVHAGGAVFDSVVNVPSGALRSARGSLTA